QQLPIYSFAQSANNAGKRKICRLKFVEKIMNQSIETEVLIVGAGPTGLALACQLVRYGVDFVIFDRKEKITDLSKAIGVQARTLEIYEQMDLATRAVEQGAIARAANIVAKGETRASIRLSDIGKDLSPFPFALLLEQSKNEGLLYDYLQSHGKEVRWQTALETISQDGEKVTATIKNAVCEIETIRAEYLVGCDGAKSLVRRGLNFEFDGDTIDALFYVADVEMEFAGNHDEIYVSFGADSFVALFPLKEENYWRIVGNLPEAEGERREESAVDYEETEARVRELLEMPLEIKGVKWFSVYRVHSRRVDKFSEGRVFLAGDAAHIHTPAGGQGMNTGIGDAYNLAWKLAFVLRGWAGGESLLDTYNTERLENAKNLLQTTDRAFNFAAQDDLLSRFVRTHVFPVAAEFALKFDWVKHAVFPLVSQIGINYRHSPLSVHADDEDFKIKAGARMPYFLIDGKSVFDFLRKPKFHFLVFSNEKSNFAEFEERIEKNGEWMDYQAFPLVPPIAEIFGADIPFCVLLRPDNHIAFISERILFDELKSYCSTKGIRF
ncbi:MAG TPA: FAD-dependent monooxygenase, partial [Pyrinomonadaceae bacterium]|nr:FAD-dependent monooxygenase [Pyrinomonadaceae bacterium]